AVGDRDRAAADLDPLDLVAGAVRTSVERRRTPDLGALRDLDLVAPGDPAVTRQMHRQRARSRTGGRVLRNPAEAEHPRLPAGARPGEAVRPESGRKTQAIQVRAQPSDLLFGAQGHVDVLRTVVVELDGYLGSLDAERGEQRLRTAVRLPGW